MYDFDKIIDRRGTGSLKWDVAENELPMWVADMDFETAPAIIEALKKRVEHGVFGYSIIPDEWQQAYVKWWKEQHAFEIEEDWLVFTTGVIPIISSAVRKFTSPGENILVQTPVYNTFFNSMVNNGRNPLESRLVYRDGQYEIDFADLEEKLADPQTSLMILCNPHNPIGKIWDRETLEKIGDLCVAHDVLVISDEIHCDLTAPGKDYIPFASVSENCKMNSITCLAPTKTFNIAGIQTAAAMSANPALRHKIWRALNTDEVGEPNVFAVDAAIAAFEHGGAWLDELKGYIQKNKELVADFISKELPQLSIVSMDATYLLWVDCSRVTDDSGVLAKHLRKETGLYVVAGEAYRGDGKHFLRINLACPKATVEDGLARLKAGVESFHEA